MRRAVLALIIGLVAGYSWGYGDGEHGKGTIADRMLERFGTSKVRAAQQAREKRVEDVMK